MADSFTPYLEAEYESGFVLCEDENDHSPYDRDRNIFHAILNFRPVEVHGKMVAFRLVTPEHTYTVDWTVLAESARPIRWKHMSHAWVDGESQGANMDGIDFGYQWNDENGKNQQEVIRIGEGPEGEVVGHVTDG